MFILIRNAHIYAPEDLGIQDIFIAHGKITAIGKLQDAITLPKLEVIDLGGQILTPGIIDQHVHLIGGGGEAGFASRTPEIKVSTIVKHGVTSVLGLLGTDGDARHPSSLFAKTKALTDEGISAWMLTGSYNFPSPTITGSVRQDILYTDPCIGGKLAISDHRSPHLSYENFIDLASDCRTAGMLSGKAGILTVHLGDAPQQLELLFRANRESAIPNQQFIPTHINRERSLYDEALKWASLGGRIDFTSSIDEGENIVSTLDAIVTAREKGIVEECIAVSSDAQGSIPIFDDKGNLSGMGIAEQDGLLQIVRDQVKYGYALTDALRPVTSTVASWLGLSNKGKIAVGADADFLILDEKINLSQTWAKGKCVYRDGKALIQGMFE